MVGGIRFACISCVELGRVYQKRTLSCAIVQNSIHARYGCDALSSRVSDAFLWYIPVGPYCPSAFSGGSGTGVGSCGPVRVASGHRRSHLNYQRSFGSRRIPNFAGHQQGAIVGVYFGGDHFRGASGNRSTSSNNCRTSYLWM